MSLDGIIIIVIFIVIFLYHLLYASMCQPQ